MRQGDKMTRNTLACLVPKAAAKAPGNEFVIVGDSLYCITGSQVFIWDFVSNEWVEKE